MSHQADEYDVQSQAVERILSDDSILQLAKDLAIAAGGKKSTDFIGVYEGLLTKKPHKGRRVFVYIQKFCSLLFSSSFC